MGAYSSPRAELLHRTVYEYDRPVRLGPQVVRLRPMADPRRVAPDYRLEVSPAPVALHWLVEPEGNVVARLVLPGAVERLELVVWLGLDMTPRNPFDVLLEPGAAAWPFVYAEEDGAESALVAYRQAGLAGPLLLGLRDATAVPGDTLGFVLGLARVVRDRVGYRVRMEAGVWPVEQTLGAECGSCRDSAWVLVQLLRLHGLAARFVSGYLVQFPDDAGRDGAELHAWAEAYLPGAGWVGLDATSGLLTAEGHVGLAASAEVAGAAPLSGTMEVAGVRLETSIVVRRAG